MNDALAKIKKQPQFYKENILFEVFEDMPYNVVGAVASRAFNFFRTTTIIIRKGEDFSRGSARSSKHLNLMKLLDYCSGLLETYGGHSQMVGFKIKNGKVEEFKEKVGEYLSRHYPNGKVSNDEIPIDATISIKDLNEELYGYLKKMAPFGPGNLVPIFCLENVKLYTNKNDLIVQDGTGMMAGNLGERFKDADLSGNHDVFGHFVFKEDKGYYFSINEIKKTKNHTK